jgi:hypothetical protein
VHNTSIIGRHGLLLLAALLATASISQLSLAQSGDPIGIVIIAKGEVQARNSSSQPRTLARYDAIFQDDTIVVGADSMVHIRMADDALFAFKEDTEFSFDAYQHDGNATTSDSAVMSMVRGGFRTISGSIGDNDEDTYRVDTPMASIGIRGTTYEALIFDNTLFTGVSVGGTTISNNAGNLDTGIGGDFDFSATVLGSAPEGLLVEPAVLNQVDFAAIPDDQPAAPGNEEGGDDPVSVAASQTRFSSAPDVTEQVTFFDFPYDQHLPSNDPYSAINPLINSRNAHELILDSGGTLPPITGKAGIP